jgi:hypothetical protein
VDIDHPRYAVWRPFYGELLPGAPAAPVVLLARDSPLWKSDAELRARLAAADSAKVDTAPQLGRLVEQMESWLAKTGATGEEREAHETLLRKQQARLDAYAEAAGLLARFQNRALEIVQAYARHAPLAVDSPGRVRLLDDPLDPYNAVFNEIREQRERIAAAVAQSWGAELGARFSGLMDQALAIHAQGPYRLNAINDRINAINEGRAGGKADKEKARQEIAAMAQEIAAGTQERLQAFATDAEAFLGALRRSFL